MSELRDDISVAAAAALRGLAAALVAGVIMESIGITEPVLGPAMAVVLLLVMATAPGVADRFRRGGA